MISLVAMSLCMVIAVAEPNSIAWADVSIRSPWDGILTGDSALMMGLVDIVDSPVTGNVIVSVGFAPMEGTTPTDRIVAKTVAETNARANVVRLAGSQVSTTMDIRTELITTDSQTGAERVKREQRVRRVLDQYTIEHAQGLVRGGRVVGTWLAPDRSAFYAALVVPLYSEVKP